MRNVDSSDWLQIPKLDVIENTGDKESGRSFRLRATQVQLVKTDEEDA